MTQQAMYHDGIIILPDHLVDDAGVEYHPTVMDIT